ncbi:hypothetical protein KKD62_00895 [Patescibacteria group bacterium]|nr:hypothetical protein [Patescibacteria group bacterium]MBU1931586.1 hypothetical protein [Patescibacteria group bacterium]
MSERAAAILVSIVGLTAAGACCLNFLAEPNRPEVVVAVPAEATAVLPPTATPWPTEPQISAVATLPPAETPIPEPTAVSSLPDSWTVTVNVKGKSYDLTQYPGCDWISVGEYMATTLYRSPVRDGKPYIPERTIIPYNCTDSDFGYGFWFWTYGEKEAFLGIGSDSIVFRVVFWDRHYFPGLQDEWIEHDYTLDNIPGEVKVVRPSAPEDFWWGKMYLMVGNADAHIYADY